MQDLYHQPYLWDFGFRDVRVGGYRGLELRGGV